MVMNGAKPNITQVGPIRYLYKQKKFNVTWDPEDGGDVVSFAQWQVSGGPSKPGWGKRTTP